MDVRELIVVVFREKVVEGEIVEAVKPKIKSEAPLSDDGEPPVLPIGKTWNISCVTC
jgi:hypothetical protein